MKAKLYYILLFGLLFLHPYHTHAIESRTTAVVSGYAFQIIEQESLTFSSNLQNQNILFFSFDDDDDDTDVSFYSRKKISVDRAFYLDITQNKSDHFLKHFFCNNFQSYFYHLPPAHFISLRVFRI